MILDKFIFLAVTTLSCISCNQGESKSQSIGHPKDKSWVVGAVDQQVLVFTGMAPDKLTSRYEYHPASPTAEARGSLLEAVWVCSRGTMWTDANSAISFILTPSEDSTTFGEVWHPTNKQLVDCVSGISQDSFSVAVAKNGHNPMQLNYLEGGAKSGARNVQKDSR